jgi:hypothetical protein
LNNWGLALQVDLFTFSQILCWELQYEIRSHI